LLGTRQVLFLYYLGLGFVIFLSWAIAVPDRQLDESAVRRYLRWTTIAAIVGLVHPAIPLAARDIIGQVGIDLPNNDDLRRRHTRATRAANTLTVLSAVPVAVLIALGSL
jgi:hypothetical protein